MRHVYILINGINTPVNKVSWVDRAENILQIKYGRYVVGYQYFSTALTRRWTLDKHAKNLERLIKRYHGEGWHVTLVGHSNGCEIISRAFKRMQEKVSHQRIDVHLFAAACEKDFDKNGFNAAKKDGNIRGLMIHVAGDDTVLKGAAKWSRRLFGWMGLGYGDLGTIRTVPDWMKIKLTPGGHSTFWTPEHMHASVVDMLAFTHPDHPNYLPLR